MRLTNAESWAVSLHCNLHPSQVVCSSFTVDVRLRHWQQSSATGWPSLESKSKPDLCCIIRCTLYSTDHTLQGTVTLSLPR